MRCAGLALRKPDRIVCYASSRLLRPFTLHCTRKRSAVEGEGAQQRKKGVADAGEPVGERSGWCGWGSWGSPGRGRVRICCKGAPGRDRRREEARNINDSPPAPRLDPGLCNRFGQLDAADPCADGGLGDHPGLRVGSPRPWASRCAFCTRAGTSNCTSRGRNAPFESKMHISTSTGPTRPPPPRTASARTAPAHGPRLPVKRLNGMASRMS